MSAPNPIHRAEIIHLNFIRHFTDTALQPTFVSQPHPIPQGETAESLRLLFESLVQVRQLDLKARALRGENLVYYSIGSAGHEANAWIGRHTRKDDPAFLHYRSGPFMAERSRKQPSVDFMRDTALSLTASRADPASAGRHKVWGNKALWVIPQTSTIASHLPKAVGAAIAIAQQKRFPQSLPVPEDAITICSFGDASLNHSTTQGALNFAQWTSFQNLEVPVLFVCEDNGLGISVKTPLHWVETSLRNRTHLKYFYADGTDLLQAQPSIQEAIDYCRQQRAPTFLHLNTVRLMGHAGTDFEIEYRPMKEIERTEAQDPLLLFSRQLVEMGVCSCSEILQLYSATGERVEAEIRQAAKTPKQASADSITKPLKISTQPARVGSDSFLQARIRHWGSEEQLPEHQPARHLAIQLNRCLQDEMLRHPNLLLFGEDVAQKGGVYTITKGLVEKFRSHRIFNTLLDETSILGLAQGFGLLGYLPVPEIQYLAFLHNALDQLRGEACSLQYFSDGQFSNPMVLRMAGLGYQKGFGGHFHNDNSIAALRDIPGIIIASPSRGDDGVKLLRSMLQLAQEQGKVCVFLEPIALYMRKDLYQPADGLWNCTYPAPNESIAFGEGRIYFPSAQDLLIISYGNGVPMALQAAKQLQEALQIQTRVLDIRWLQPLHQNTLVKATTGIHKILILDEGRASASLADSICSLLVQANLADVKIKIITGKDSYIPLADAANLVLPQVGDLVTAAKEIL